MMLKFIERLESGDIDLPGDMDDLVRAAAESSEGEDIDEWAMRIASDICALPLEKRAPGLAWGVSFGYPTLLVTEGRGAR